MPGEYPKESLDTKAKRDTFYNLYFGTMTAIIPALVTGIMLEPYVVLGMVIGTLVLATYIWWVFRYNIFGRLMGQFKWLNDDD